MGRGRASVGSDEGSAVVLVAVVMVFTALMALAVVELGVAAAHRSRAQTAADAAALAAVSAPVSASVSEARSAAVRLARANGAALVSFRRSGWVVTVVVEVGEARATARATNGP